MSLISDIIARLTRNESRVNDFVNGDNNKVVDTDNGPIPSLAKLVKDNQEKIDAFMPAIDDKQGRLEKDASGGYVGIGADFMIRVKNAAGDVASWLTTNATAVRTWTLPDDSGELALKKNVPAAETKDSILGKLGATEVTGKNTGDQTLESLGAQAALGFPPLDSRLADEPNGFPVLDENAQLDPKYFPNTTKSVIYFNDVTDFPAEGEVDKLYVDTSHKKAYFWLPGNSPAPGSYESTTVDVGNTDTLVEGDENLFFSVQRVLDVTLYGFNLLTGSTILGSDTIVQAFGKAQKQLNEILLAIALLAPKANPSFTGNVEVPDTTSANDDLRAVNTRSLNQRLIALNDGVMQAVMQRETLWNKAIDFSVVNNTLYPSVQAVKNYTDSLLVKVIKDCGNWDPNSGSYPTTGGTGDGGVIKAGNLWYVNVAGSFGGKDWNKGDSIRALIDNPGQTAANWADMESNIGYVPLNREGDTIGWLESSGLIHTTDVIKGDFGVESKNYLQAGGGGAGQGGRVILKDDGNTARWMMGLSATAGVKNWQLYDIANARAIWTVDYQTGATTIHYNATFNGTATLKGFFLSQGTAGDNGGQIRLSRPGLPYWMLEDTNQVVNGKRWGGWIEADGTFTIGYTDDAGAGTKVINLARTGAGTIWGSSHTVRNTASSDTASTVDGVAGFSKIVKFLTSTVNRWHIGVNQAAESGANAGSDFVINRFNDAGVYQDTPMTISRASGIVSFLLSPLVPTPSTADNSTKAINSAWLRSLIGVANGLAPLGSDSKISSVYLPSYVDDVIEYATKAAMTAVTPGESGKIYVVLADESNGNATWQYRWSGSAFVAITPSPGTTDSVVEGATNKYFTTARVLSTALTGLSVATSAVVLATDTVLAAIGKLQAQITAIPYDLGGGFAGKPAANDFQIFHVAIRTFTIPAGLALAKGVVATAPAASYTLSFTKNGVQFATCTFGAGSTTCTWTMASNTTVVAGDVLRVVAPASADANFSDFTFTMPATLG